MLSLGPIIFGFLLGLIIATQIKLNTGDTRFTAGSFAVILISGVLVACQSGQFPFYTDLPVSTAFLSALIGILLGILLFGRRK